MGEKTQAKGDKKSVQKTDKNSKDSNIDKQQQNTQQPESPRDRKKEFFREELKRLKNSLQDESEKIVAPEPVEYKPFIFNTLEPYYNCHTQDYLFDLPEELRHHYVSRNTALGLCDPWENHRLDVDLLPKIPSTPRESEVKTPRGTDTERPQKEGSTHLPKFPSVTQTMAMPKDQKRIMPYDEVPKLREEIRTKFSSQADARINEDYKRTKDDFYRMELDKMEEIHPINRDHMRRTYCAYLQNTPGSKKALNECLKSLPVEKGKEKKEKDNKAKQSKTKEQLPATKA